MDPEAACVPALHPAGVVDAILAKRNLGTALTDAPAVVGVGPGFTPRVDCHAAVETQRGHDLGRVLWGPPSAPPTPGCRGRSAATPWNGSSGPRRPASSSPPPSIGETVSAGQVVGTVAGFP